MSAVTRNDDAYIRQFLNGAIETAEHALQSYKDGHLTSALRATSRTIHYGKSATQVLVKVRTEAQEAAERAER